MARTGPPPLAPNVRRHLGLNLRTFYAATLAEPVGERIAAVLDRLGKAPLEKAPLEKASPDESSS